MQFICVFFLQNAPKSILKPTVTFAPAPQFSVGGGGGGDSPSTFGNNATSRNNAAVSNNLDSAGDVLDNALISAMTNPRERMALLQIENSILIFVKSR